MYSKKLFQGLREKSLSLRSRMYDQCSAIDEIEFLDQLLDEHNKGMAKFSVTRNMYGVKVFGTELSKYIADAIGQYIEDELEKLEQSK